MTPRWEKEKWNVTSPNDDEIVCKDCIYRLKDRKAGDTVIHGASLGECDVFKIKPVPILMDGEECPYYLSETECNAE